MPKIPEISPQIIPLTPVHFFRFVVDREGWIGETALDVKLLN